MRLLVTADLHYNHPRSRPLADGLIDEMNGVEADALLLIGDTAAGESDALKRCLERFRFDGPKLFVAGNHELWTSGRDSHALFREELPRRVRSLGWHWLQEEPFIAAPIAIVGTIGWYDYSFAQDQLGIPRRFYEAKVSPGAAAGPPEFGHLLEVADDVPDQAREVVARWNDGRFVRLHRPDERFLEELLGQLEEQLRSLAATPFIVVASHHIPFRELLPPAGNVHWDFARAYLGSERLGALLLRFANVKMVLCGHSHHAAEARIGQIRAINIGSGYRSKTYRVFDLP